MFCTLEIALLWFSPNLNILHASDHIFKKSMSNSRGLLWISWFDVHPGLNVMGVASVPCSFCIPLVAAARHSYKFTEGWNLWREVISSPERCKNQKLSHWFTFSPSKMLHVIIIFKSKGFLSSVMVKHWYTFIWL